jgi:alpha/beta hydrolase fold
MVEPLLGDQGGLRELFVDAEGIKLHCLEWDPDLSVEGTFIVPRWAENGDEIPLVMLHGLEATADTWRMVAPYLCGNHQVVAFDQRGHGLSDQPDDGYDLVTVAEDVVHGMAALGLGKVALVGHGWGAKVALVLNTFQIRAWDTSWCGMGKRTSMSTKSSNCSCGSKGSGGGRWRFLGLYLL